MSGAGGIYNLVNQSQLALGEGRFGLAGGLQALAMARSSSVLAVRPAASAARMALSRIDFTSLKHDYKNGFILYILGILFTVLR
jgi:hypothetical protein